MEIRQVGQAESLPRDALAVQQRRDIGRIAAEVGQRAAEGTDGARHRQLVGDEAGDGFGGEYAAGGAAVDADLGRLVLLEQRAIDRLHVVAGGGEAVLGPLPIVDADDLDAADAGDRNGLDQSTAMRAPQEGTAVQVDQHAVRILRGHALRGKHDGGADAGDGFSMGLYRIQLFHARGTVAVHVVVERTALGDRCRQWGRLAAGGQHLRKESPCFRRCEIRIRHGCRGRRHTAVGLHAG